jgi:hypothetical protein
VEQGDPFPLDEEFEKNLSIEKIREVQDARL